MTVTAGLNRATTPPRDTVSRVPLGMGTSVCGSCSPLWASQSWLGRRSPPEVETSIHTSFENIVLKVPQDEKGEENAALDLEELEEGHLVKPSDVEALIRTSIENIVLKVQGDENGEGNAASGLEELEEGHLVKPANANTNAGEMAKGKGGNVQDAQDAQEAREEEPDEKKDRFYELLFAIHCAITHLPGYKSFLTKYFLYTLPLMLKGVTLIWLVTLARNSCEQLFVWMMNYYGMNVPTNFPFKGSNITVATASSFSFGTSHLVVLVVVLAWLAVSALGGLLFPLWRDVLMEDFKGSLMSEQMGRLVAKILSLPYDTMISTPGGEFNQIMMKVWQNDALLPNLYGKIFPTLIELTLITVFLFLRHFPVVWVPAALLWVNTRWALWKAARDEEQQTKMRTMFMKNMGKLMGLGDCYERAHYFDNVEHERKQTVSLFDMIGTTMGEMKKQGMYDGLWLPLLGFVANPVAGMITAGYLGYVEFYEGFCTGWFGWLLYWFRASPGDDSKFVGEKSRVGILEVALVVHYIFKYSVQWTTTIGAVRKAIYDSEEVQTWLDKKSGVADVPDAIDLAPHNNPTIEFQNVTFTYGGKDILNDVSFKLKGGQRLGLAGTSGCGKTTILKLLCRFYPLEGKAAGKILVDGKDISKVTRASLLRLFSVVAQNADIFGGTVLENIRYGRLSATEEEVLEAGRLAGLVLNTNPVKEEKEMANFVHSEDGELSIHHDCGEKGAKLSGGQRQRVQLARAILKRGSIYLLDEPTTGLDGVVSRKLQDTMDELSKDATTVCITHHLEDLKNADKILYLEQGRIKEEGTYNELIGLERGVFAEQVQARKR